MINNIEYNDIEMRDLTSNSFSSYLNRIRPRKRTYLEMLNNSNEVILNNRIDHYKLNRHTQNYHSLYNNTINNEERDNYLIANFEGFNVINNVKKNLIVKKKLEYDKEKEKKWVENYYKIKNAELNKLRFGTD